MGSALLMEFAFLPKDADTEAMRENIKLRIYSSPFEAIEERVRKLYEELYGESLEDVEQEDIIPNMTCIVDDFFDMVRDMPRDVMWIDRKDERMYLSGGESWGDAPTNSYTIIYNYNELMRIMFDEER